jgi:sugar phosphate isomerase/epimerase
MTVYISTGGYKDKPIKFVLNKFRINNIKNVELSGGKYNKDIYNDLLKNKFNFQIHNYFPVPKKSFVLNLASHDPHISKLTMSHVKRSIRLANRIKSKYYSIHAGFLCDLKPSDLGKKIKKLKLNNKKKSIQIFLKNLKKVSVYAKRYNIQIMIENNVITKSNLREFGKNPLLMCEPSECLKILKKFPKNIKMLLDVAHLKVSSKTMGFKKEDMFIKCKDFIQGYHLSDNNGLKDSNKKFTINSWFWKYLNKRLDYYSVEVYREKEKDLLNLQNIVEKKLNV